MDYFYTHSASVAKYFPCFTRLTFYLIIFFFLRFSRGRRCFEGKHLSVLTKSDKCEMKGRPVRMLPELYTTEYWFFILFAWRLLFFIFRACVRRCCESFSDCFYLVLTSTHNHFGAKQVDMMLQFCARTIHTTDIWWFSDTQPADVM